MVRWSTKMRRIPILIWVLATWLLVSAQAITVSIERSDNKPLPTRSSMIANGWRPLTKSYDEPETNLDRTSAVLHPVLGKFQEHMAASEKLKPQRKTKPVHQEYNPPSILGSFTVFGHAATKARVEAHGNHPGKYVPSETREYTFLVPPPKDSYRFELEPQRKPILRQPFIQNLPDPVRAATYFIKGYTSTTNSPSPGTPHGKPSRPFQGGYSVPQILQPPRHQAKPFESLKVKPYFQPPSTAVPQDFAKDKQPFEHRFQSQVIQPGSFFGQVNHPYKTSFERDPAYLVHESHEVSYVTPPSTFNPFSFRPSVPYETLLPPGIYSSTPTPTTGLPQGGKFQNERPGQAKPDDRPQSEPLPGSNGFYITEHRDLWTQKTKYPSDINEVLPRVNPPSKFSQEVIDQIPQAPKVVYVRPQQQQHYQSSIVPLDVRPQTTEPDYETPESISLKHFNEQQFLIQQQLVQRDRQRLAEQERQQQLEIERQQQEELRKRQEELKQLIQRQKQDEEARLALESARNQTEQLVPVVQLTPEEQPPYTIQLAQFEVSKVTEHPGFGQEPRTQQPQQVHQPEVAVSETPVEQSQYQPEQKQHSYREQQQPEQEQHNYREQPQPEQEQHNYREQPQPEQEQHNYREQPQPEQEQHNYREQPEQRPQKLAKPYRRRKPTTPSYTTTEQIVTELPAPVPGTSPPLVVHVEEIPIQTTVEPETVTQATLRPRLRRPGGPGRRRRPSTTTQETITEVDDFLKFEKPEEQLEGSRRRRIKPTAASFYENTTERRANIRKRPGHRNRVNPGEPFEAEIVTEIVHTSIEQGVKPFDQSSKLFDQGTKPFDQGTKSYDQGTNSYEQGSNSYDQGSSSVDQGTKGYEASQGHTEGQFVTEGQFFDFSSQRLHPGEEQVTTVPSHLEYLTETTRPRVEYSTEEQGHQTNTNIPLENLFSRTEGTYFDRATPVSSTTAAPTTTTEATTTTTLAQVTSTRAHKVRPLRYGNSTRPRFSIKDYKTRQDYKSRVSQLSSTESPTTPAQTRQRTTTPRSQADGSTRYKYMSRVNYRTTTTTTIVPDRSVPEETPSSTTEKSRFVPRRRPITANVYRSRVSGTTSSPKSHQEVDPQQKPSTARPENVFSSSVRRRPMMKPRLHPKQPKPEDATEMAAEETSFYSAATTMPPTRVSPNEIPVEKPSSTLRSTTEPENIVTLTNFQTEEEAPSTEPVPVSSGQDLAEPVTKAETEPAGTRMEENAEEKMEDKTVEKMEDKMEATTRFEIETDEEELFAKASQSVADLTSSASALYDKPGMFKAVSPEVRAPSQRFKVNTDEPTLPIEAFFQELSKKN